jgi:tetratricopeptide (TPR) repeat protein
MDVLTGLVSLYARQGEAEKAMALCDRKLTEFDSDPIILAVIYSLKGDLYLVQGNTAEAEATFKKSIENHSNFLHPYYALSILRLQENREEEAIAQYEAILEKDPDQARAHMMLGTIYEKKKQFEPAEKHYREALRIKPDFASAANNLAYILISADKNPDDALYFARRAKEVLPDDPRVADTLGWIYYKKGYYDIARRELTRSLKLLPNSAVVHYHLAMTLLQIGESEQVRLLLEKALSLDDSFDGAEEARDTLLKL